MSKPALTILLAAPRGFCAGVDRAVQIVELALKKYGAPVYVRHEIVHNKYVVDGLRDKGAIFVEELHQIPDDGQPVIFSAHGVAKSIPQEAKTREMFYIDATCPLVSKVHREAERYFKQGNQIILIGHAGHPEVIGTMGQLPEGAVLLVETVEDIKTLTVENPDNLSFCTQTTLSVDDTAEIVTALQTKFPTIEGPRTEDICYATTNRQAAVKAIADRSDGMLVIGAANSSNSNRLVEVAQNHGCPKAILIRGAQDLEKQWLDGVQTIGLTAGASAPDILIENVINALKETNTVTVEEVTTAEEDITFKIPKVLKDVA